MHRTSLCALVAVLLSAAGGTSAHAAVTPPAGYIYSPQVLNSVTANCIAVGPGGTFISVGPSFIANAVSVVFVKESGETRLIASGFNSIGDCAYNAGTDTLYVTDNADNTDLMAGFSGAQTGDTVFAIANASTISARQAPDVTLLPANSVEFAANLAITAGGDVLVSNPGMGTSGTVLKISAGPSTSTFASMFNFAGGLAIDPTSGDVFVAESVGMGNSQISRFTSAGGVVARPWLAPTMTVGSADLVLNTDGKLLASGVYFGNVVAIDLAGPTTSTFISGLTYAGGMSVNRFTGRIEILSATFNFPAEPEDKTVSRFVPVSRLVPPSASGETECLHEFYGIELVAEEMGGDAKDAICVDGAACDADGKVNDSCTFPVGSCLNVTDARLPECTPTDAIATFSASVGKDRSLVTMSTAVTAALPSAAQQCFFSDGVTVPVKVKSPTEKKAGKAKVSVSVTTSMGDKDKDVVKLVCKPA